jgi:hypothetical protein
MLNVKPLFRNHVVSNSLQMTKTRCFHVFWPNCEQMSELSFDYRVINNAVRTIFSVPNPPSKLGVNTVSTQAVCS